MAGTKKSPLWRKVFLRALARTGNARASAVEAGIDVGTAYDHRIRDPAFAGQWAAALAKAKASAKRPRPLHHIPPRSGEELVLRRTRHGDKMVRAAAGRWSSRVEESFLAGLELTGCVQSAAAAAGISTTALYERRKHYPEFAARWDEAAGRAGQELPAMLQAAARDSLSRPPEAPGQKRRGRARLPRIDVDQAIRISAIAARKEAGGGRRREWRAIQRKQEKTHEELVQQLMTMLDALEKRQRKARLGEGWSDAGNGLLIPPGWVREEGKGNGDSHE
jgi:hypothetical protein